MSDERPTLKVLPHKPKGVLWPDPADAIREFAEDTAAGKIKPVKVLILYYEEHPETKRLMPHSWWSGVTHFEGIALLELAKHQAIESAKEP